MSEKLNINLDIYNCCWNVQRTLREICDHVRSKDNRCELGGSGGLKLSLPAEEYITFLRQPWVRKDGEIDLNIECVYLWGLVIRRGKGCYVEVVGDTTTDYSHLFNFSFE